MRNLRRISSLGLFLAAVLFVGCDDDPDVVGVGGDAVVRTDQFQFRIADADINGRFVSARYDAPLITPTAVDEGAVLAFFREANTWTAMPYTYGIESDDLAAVDYTVTLGYAYEFDNQGGFVDIFYEASTDEIDLEGLPDQTIRLVVIDRLPPAKAGLDLTDYESVREYFGLAE